MNTYKTKFCKKPYAVFILCLGLGLMANTVSAQILLATTNYFEQRGASSADLDLDLELDGNQLGIQSSKQFRTSTPNKLVRIIFNAEGSVASGFDSTVPIAG
jgi:hypothetical protein